MLPASFVRVASLPLTSNGKPTDRRHRRFRRIRSQMSGIAPARLWKCESRRSSKICSAEEDGIDDNFLLGGHSPLDATAPACEVFGADLTLRLV
jgi:hypothetical protein